MGQQETYEKQFVALGGVLQTLREEENVDVLIQAALEYLKAEFSYRLVWIGLYDRVEHRLLGKGGVTPTGDVTFLKQRFFLNPGDLLEQVVIQLRPVGIPDLREEVRAGEWRRAAQDFGIQGTLLFPLRCKDRCFGVALLGSHLWGTTPRVAEKAQLSLLFGGLASTLYQIEVQWQHASMKRPDQPLFQILEQLQNLVNLEKRLEVVVNMSQDFVAPTRTNLYWYSPERRYFWQRVGNRQAVRRLRDAENSPAGLNVQEVSEFYLALTAGQTVAIGSGKSPLKADITGSLLSRLRSRSVLAAPILVKGELLGFLAAEDNEPRIWEEADKNYVRAAAQVIALVAGREDMEATLQETQNDANLIAEVSAAISGDTDPQIALKHCAELLLEHLGVERFLLLQESGQPLLIGSNPQPTTDQEQRSKDATYTFSYQQQSPKRRPLSTPLNVLTGKDRQLLEGSDSAIAIEDTEKDRRLEEWRESLMEAGVRSLLVCRTSTQGDRLLMIANGTPRTWNQTELRVVGIVSQQIGLLLNSLDIKTVADQLAVAQKTLQAGLTALLAAPSDPAQFERAWMQYLAQVLKCPVVALLGWKPQKPKSSTPMSASLQGAVVTDPNIRLSPDLSVPLTDPLIQKTFATRGFVGSSVAQLTPGTGRWLSNSGIETLLVMALYPAPGVAPSGIVLLGDRQEREWPRHLLPLLEILIQQIAGLRSYRQLQANLSREMRELEHLNWYKYRCLEILNHAVTTSISALLELDSPEGQVNGDQALRRMRSSQILHQLENTLATLSPLLNEEQWKMQTRIAPVSLETLLKRSLRRVESLYNQRQLSVQFKNTANLNVYGDRLKLECVLFELLVAACYRAQPGNRIDLWCRPLKPEAKNKGLPESSSNVAPASPVSEQASSVGEATPVLAVGESPSRGEPRATSTPSPFIEMFITDNEPTKPSPGTLEMPSHDGHTTPFTLPSSPLNQPPSMNLKICQRILRSWGSDLQFYQLENNRFLSRLILKCQ